MNKTHRVTIDEDSHHHSIWLWRILKGILYTHKRPDYIKTTERGIHIIWKNVCRTEEESMELRRKIGDCTNRMRLDSISNKRLHQVLFSDKTTTQINRIHPVWFRIINRKPIKSKGIPKFDICPECFEKVISSEKIWEQGDNDYYINIQHKTHNCQFVMAKRPLPWLLRKLHKDQRYGANPVYLADEYIDRIEEYSKAKLKSEEGMTFRFTEEEKKLLQQNA